MMRPIRAFVKALQMTVKGETITPSHYQPLEAWIDAGLGMLASVVIAADAQGLPQDQRTQIKLKLDGHMTSFDQTLAMVRHNLVNEYPKLIKLDDPYTMMVIQSSNMNDQYRIGRFATADEITSIEVKTRLEALNEHLMNLPTIERPEE